MCGYMERIHLRFYQGYKICLFFTRPALSTSLSTPETQLSAHSSLVVRC